MTPEPCVVCGGRGWIGDGIHSAYSCFVCIGSGKRPPLWGWAASLGPENSSEVGTGAKEKSKVMRTKKELDAAWAAVGMATGGGLLEAVVLNNLRYDEHAAGAKAERDRILERITDYARRFPQFVPVESIVGYCAALGEELRSPGERT